MFLSAVCKECLWMDSILEPVKNIKISPPSVLNKPIKIQLPKIKFIMPRRVEVKFKESSKSIKTRTKQKRTTKPKTTKAPRIPNSVSRIERHKKYLEEHPHLVNRSREIRKTREFEAGGACLNWASWGIILRKYGTKCLCCGVEGVVLTQDHVLPISLGGKTIPENIQPLCKSCNSRKNDRYIDYRPFI